MSIVSNYTEQQFVDEFSLDLGNGVRGQTVSLDSGFRGLIISHLVGMELCSIVVCFQLADDRYVKNSGRSGSTLWGVVSKDGAPLTVNGPPIECINCPKKHVGHIKDGQWLVM